MKLSFIVLITSVVLMAMCSCGADASLQKDDLVGEWKVVSAQRNGKVTELVNGVTFMFDDSGSMKTNMPGVESKGSFTLEEQKLVHHGKSEVLYNLNHLTRDSMQLAVDLQGLNFVLDLVRQQSRK